MLRLLKLIFLCLLFLTKIQLIINKMTSFKRIIFLLLILIVSQSTTSYPGIGTTLPSLTSNSNYRVFNDLMKQSLPFVPYKLQYGTFARCWGCNFTLIGGLAHQYPATLPSLFWGVAEIQFNSGDSGLAAQTFQLAFKGTGGVGVLQGSLNKTWTSNAGGTFVLPSVSTSLFVYVFNTSGTDPVNSISITLSFLGANPPTFTSNFINYLKPFDFIRTCYWQGQNLYKSAWTTQTWASRPLLSASTQISSYGIALQHILELQSLGLILWPCIPDTADKDYITKMGTLFAAKRDRTQLMYLQFGNVYTIMNNFPDLVTTPAFDTFMQAYGPTYRQSILFTINYQSIQYYINAMGMRVSPPINYTYIDAIGFSGDFGVLGVQTADGLSDSDLKKLIISNQLAYQVTVNQAFQISKMNGTDLVMYSGGPYLKTPTWRYIWQSSQNPTNGSLSTLAQKETALYNRLTTMTLNDPWVQELYLHWIARLTSMGVNTILFSQLVGTFTWNSDIVPLQPNLNSPTQMFNALLDYAQNGRTTTLPTSGVVPPNPFTCSPSCQWGDCINNLCSCYAGYSGPSCSVYTQPTQQNKVGVNLQGISYWTTQHPFIDMHREGSAWVYFTIKGGWSSGSAYQNQVPLDANGYPTYLPPGITVGTLIARDVNTHYDNGTYIILYDGDGVLIFGMYDLLAVRYGIGRIEVDVAPSTNFNNGLLVTITRTNPNDHVRNIRVIRPGFEGVWQAINFSPLMLEKLQPYGTLRFMDWTDTNGQTDQDWGKRTLPSWRTYTAKGVAWEETIRLCNTLGKNAWINIPHQANDDYITQLAQLFKDTLEPHLTVYVEYSNEVWGSLFPGGQYAQNMGVRLNYTTDPTQARFCYLGQRTQDISDIWWSVFGRNSTQLKIVISTQAVNADTTNRILACRNTYAKVNAVAIAPYLSVTVAGNTSLDTMFAQLTTQVTAVGLMVASHLKFTNNHSLPLLCYESGQGLGGVTSAINAQSDPRMRTIYRIYLQALFNNSIQLANHYTDSGVWGQYGSWGLYQYTDEFPQSGQKWLGIKDYLAEQSLTFPVLEYAACSTNCNDKGICMYGRCSCYTGFSGDDCTVGKYIDYIDCAYLCTFNQGTCVLNTTVGINRYYNCICNPGYTGYYCSIPVCTAKCSYAGTCIAPQTCSCFRGRMGPNCQINCGCNGHGTCNSGGTCLCDAGFLFNNTTKRCQFSCFNKTSFNCYGPNLLACNGCQSGTCNNGTCICWPGFSGDNCTIEIPVNYVQPNLGINLGGLNYWSTQHLLKDYFKQSSTWIPAYYPGAVNGSIQYTWNTGQSFPTLPNGYPSLLYSNMTVGKLLLRDLNGYYPNIKQTNQYVLLYDGEGVINLGFDATAYEISAGRIRFTVTPSTVRDNGVYVLLMATNPANPVTNIRVVLAQDEYTYQDVLTDNILRFLSQFSTIRFMDMMGANGSPVIEWNQTTLPDSHTQASPSGISIDLLTKIINRSGRNAWVNIPYLASDDYVKKLANFLKANITSATRTIYVQYSNEVWNSFFEQGKYANAQAVAQNLSNGHKFYAMRTMQVYNIFKGVFGSSYSRLKLVVSYQAVSKWVADQILTYTAVVNGSSVTLASVAGLIAAAPYYDCNSIGNSSNVGKVAAGTPDTVLQMCTNNFPSLTPILQIESTVSAAYGNLPMGTYEAGTSISQQQTIYNGGDTPTATTNFIAANRSPGMYAIYKSMLCNYQQNKLMATAPLMLFSAIGLPSKYGSWGVLDYLDQINETPTHPKFQAILDINAGKPCP